MYIVTSSSAIWSRSFKTSRTFVRIVPMLPFHLQGHHRKPDYFFLIGLSMQLVTHVIVNTILLIRYDVFFNKLFLNIVQGRGQTIISVYEWSICTRGICFNGITSSLFPRTYSLLSLSSLSYLTGATLPLSHTACIAGYRRCLV